MIILFAALWLAGWILAARFHRPLSARKLKANQDFSIIIPARNEAHNLPKLLKSIASQSIIPIEILVVDDGSSDDTADIARQFGATVITSDPLPDSWRGKTWACHQGAMKARGDLLLFIDADTWFEPGGLEHALSVQHDGALSIVPYHAVQKIHEDLSLFFNICMTAGTVPMGLAGQFLTVKRTHYQLVGGHESVRGNILENFRLAEKFQAAGIPLTSITGKGILSFRMYPDGARDLMHGWTKGFAAGAGGTATKTLFLVIAWMTGLMIAPLMLTMTNDQPLWVTACLLCSLQMVCIGRLLGSFGWTMLLIYPFPLLFFFGTFAWSALRSGKKVTWKGREINAD